MVYWQRDRRREAGKRAGVSKAEGKVSQPLRTPASAGAKPAAQALPTIDFLGVFSLLVSGLLILVTGLVFAVPDLRLIPGGRELSLVIESFGAIVGLGVFYVGLARFVSDGRYSELCISLAFFAFFAASTVYGVAFPMVKPDFSHAEELRTYGLLSTRLFGGLLLVLGYFLADYQAPRKARAYRSLTATAWLAEAGLAIGLLLYLVRDRLPPLSTISRTTAGAFSSPEVTLHLAIVLTLLSGAFAYYLAYRQSQDAVTGCLSLGLIIGAFGELHLASAPVSYRDAVTSGDLVRLLSNVVLLAGLSIDYLQSFVRLQAQHSELAALYRMATVPVSSRNLVQALEDICATIRVSLQAEKAIALLYDTEADELEVLPPPDGEPGQSRLSSRQAAPAMTVLRNGRPLICPGGPSGGWLAPIVGLPASSIRQALLVPLRIEGRSIGVLVAANRLEEGFGAEEEHLLTVMALRTAMIIENTRLYDHVEAAAALDERASLAREVHDGLAQSLSFLNLKLGQVLSRGGLPPQEYGELKEIKRVGETALAEARQSIAALRTGPSREESFFDTLRRYAEDFGEDHDLEVVVTREEGVPPLRPQVRVELLRIVQEALNNVRKHAHASRVELTLAPTPDGLIVRVRDDGQGFADDAAPPGQGQHYGLVGMRERAERLGGRLKLQSEPGEGTVVEVEVPAPSRGAATEERER